MLCKASFASSHECSKIFTYVWIYCADSDRDILLQESLVFFIIVTIQVNKLFWSFLNFVTGIHIGLLYFTSIVTTKNNNRKLNNFLILL